MSGMHTIRVKSESRETSLESYRPSPLAPEPGTSGSAATRPAERAESR